MGRGVHLVVQKKYGTFGDCFLISMEFMRKVTLTGVNHIKMQSTIIFLAYKVLNKSNLAKLHPKDPNLTSYVERELIFAFLHCLLI